MSELSSAIRQICEEKGLAFEAVVETIELALAAAYRKDYGGKNQNIKVEFDSETGKSKVYDAKIIVSDLTEEELLAIEKRKEEFLNREEKTEGKPAGSAPAVPESAEEGDLGEEKEEERKFNPKTEIQLTDAKQIKKTAKIGDEIKMKLEVPESYGRMAAQTAKQVIIQKLREAEREMVMNEFKDKEHEVITGVVQRREGRIVLVDLGKTVGIIGPEDQIKMERYNPGDRVKVYVKSVNVTARGPEILLSRTSEEVLKKIFYLEIPEISNGLVELMAVAREAGARSKVAVAASADNIDPIGSCVGQRGSRIQTIISELGGEKIDIIQYDELPVKFIANALSPAKTVSIEINEEEKKAIVTVNSDQLSLAIGRGGQNVRLAAALTGWKIDIREIGGEKAEAVVSIPEEKPLEEAGSPVGETEGSAEESKGENQEK